MSGTTQSLSNLKGYVVAGVASENLSNLKGYVVLGSAQANLSNLKGYVVLKGTTPYPFQQPISLSRQWWARQRPQDNRPIARRRAGVGPVLGFPPKALTDSAASSEALGGVVSGSVALTDSVTSSDTYAGGIAYGAALADTIASSEIVTDSLQITNSLSDTVGSADAYGQPAVLLAGLNRQALAAGGGSNPVAFGQIARKVLATSASSAGSFASFSQLRRKVLVQIDPYASFGPIPVFPTLPQGFPIKVVPTMDTVIGTTKSLREVRVGR